MLSDTEIYGEPFWIRTSDLLIKSITFQNITHHLVTAYRPFFYEISTLLEKHIASGDFIFFRLNQVVCDPIDTLHHAFD